MKNQSNTEIEVRKITRVGSKRNSWIVTIPPKFIKDLEMEDSFVTFQIIKKMIIITKVTSKITRKKLDAIESENISEETTTTNNKVKTESTAWEKLSQEEREKILKRNTEPDYDFDCTDEKPDEELKMDENDRADERLDDIEKQYDENNTKEIKREPESSTEKQNEKDRISKLIEDSVNKIEL